MDKNKTGQWLKEDWSMDKIGQWIKRAGNLISWLSSVTNPHY